MPFFPRHSAKKYALNFPSEHCRWQTMRQLQGAGGGTGRGPRSYRKQEQYQWQPEHGEGVAKTKRKKQGQTNENIFCQSAENYATKTRAKLKHPHSRTVVVGSPPKAYRISIHRARAVAGKRSTCCHRQTGLLISLTHLSQLPAAGPDDLLACQATRRGRKQRVAGLSFGEVSTTARNLRKFVYDS